MDFRMFRPINIVALGRMCWAALAVAMLITVSTAEVQAQSYNVRPGDTLRIEVLEDPSLNRSVLVAPDGRISIPSAGNVRAAGQSIDSLQRVVTDQLAGNFASPPNVFVSLERLYEPSTALGELALEPTISVYLVGEVGRPGVLEVPPGTNVLQLFAMSGGFSNFAATKRIQLRSVDLQAGTQTIRTLNYKAIEAGGVGGLTTLRDGDIVVVPQRRLFE